MTDDGFDHADLDATDEHTIPAVVKALKSFGSDSWSDHPAAVAAHAARGFEIIERRLKALEKKGK